MEMIKYICNEYLYNKMYKNLKNCIVYSFYRIKYTYDTGYFY